MGDYIVENFGVWNIVNIWNYEKPHNLMKYTFEL